MFYRRKVILALLQNFGRPLPSLDFQKYLFLLSQIQQKKSYDFVPYKFGCFSFQSYADKRAMAGAGLLEPEEGWKLKTTHNYLLELAESDQQAIRTLKQKFGALRGDGLVKYVYRAYPYYAINSEIAGNLLGPIDIQKIAAQKNTRKEPVLFTIGYEGKSIDAYLNQLIQNNVWLLCDVRKNPFSMKYGFSKNQLKTTLANLGIGYLHLPELGIESGKRKNLESEADYKKLFDDYEKNTLPGQKQALKVLTAVLENKKRVAMTCFEASHQSCHRGRLAQYLALSPSWSFPVSHL